MVALLLCLATLDGPDLAREVIDLDHWRIRCVKPAGLARIDAKHFDASEKANSVVLKFDAVREHCRCMVRIYATRKRLKIDELARLRTEEFRKRFPQGQRRAPELDKKWKTRRAKRTLRLRLMGRRKVREVSLWHFVQARNGRVYQIEIYLSGTQGERVWKKQVDELLLAFTILS